MNYFIHSPWPITLSRFFALGLLCAEIVFFSCTPFRPGLGSIGLLLFTSVVCLAFAVMTCIHAHWALRVLSLLFIVVPLCFWVLVDFWVLRPSGFFDLISGLFLQMAIPLIFSYFLITSKSVRAYYGCTTPPRLFIRFNKWNLEIHSTPHHCETGSDK